MLLTKLIAFFVLTTLSSQAAIVPLESFSKVTKNSHSDIALARTIHSTIKGLKAGRLYPKNASRILAQSKKSPYFRDMTEIFALTRQIASTQKSKTAYLKSCSQVESFINGKDHAEISRKFAKEVMEYCRNLFLTHMISVKRHSVFTLAQKTFLENSLKSFVTGGHSRKFHQFLKTIPQDSKAYFQVSTMISKEALELEVVPSEEVLSFIKIDKDLTQLVQKQGLLFDDSSNYFKNEFRRLANKTTALIRTGEFDQALEILKTSKRFYTENSQYMTQHFAWHSFNLSGKRFTYNKKFRYAKIAFEYALDVSNSSQKDESYFYILWPEIVQKNYKKAKNLVDRYQMLEGLETKNSKLRFWVTKIFDMTGEKRKAQEMYSKIAESEPLSFYGILSLKELSQNNPAQISHRIISKLRAPSSSLNPQELKPSLKLTRTLGRLSTWLDLDLDQYSYSEINSLLNAKPQELFDNIGDVSEQEFSQFLLNQMSYFFNSKEKYLHSFRLIYNALNSTDTPLNGHLISSLYPLHYYEKIKSIDDEINPLLVMSLIRQESAFNTRARSVAGARGLMQLMPNTARMLHGRLNAVQLYDSDLNLRLGIKYFKRLEKKYDGDLIDVLSAYNAGEGNLKSWKENIFVFGEDSPLEKIEMIPFNETRKYVKLIYRNLFYYRLLTNDPIVGETLAETLKVSVN